MRILLINPFKYFGINKSLHRRYPVPAVTLPYLSSLIPDGHQVDILDEAVDVIDYGTPADLVGITTLTVNAHRAYEIAREFRQRGAKVVMGGPHVSAVPEEAIRYCDALAIGNAEATLPQIVRDAESGTLQQFYLNTQPRAIPSRIIGSVESGWQTSILASRGCELSCDFCSMQNIFGKFYLQRDARSTIEDVLQAKSRMLSFVDDNFYGASTASQAYYDRILDAINQNDKQWVAQVRLPILRNERVLKKFRDSNCAGLFIGFESINKDNSRAIKKKVDKELYTRQIDKIHAYGIGVIGSFIFGFDSDTPQTIEETVDFCIDTGMEMTAFSILTPYPGTKVYKDLKDQGRLLSEDWRLYDSDRALFQPINFSPEELEHQVLMAAKRFYSTSSIVKRMKFGMNYNPFKLYLLPNLLRKFSLLSM